MAENDIIVAKEGASGTLSEIALAPSDIGAANASHTHTATDIDSGASAAGTFLQSNGSGGSGWNTVSYQDLDDVPSSFTPASHASSHAAAGSDPVFDQNLNTTDSVSFGIVTSQSFLVYNATSGFTVELDTSGGLGDDRTLSLPDASGTIALTADIPDPSSATPQALGSASAGSSDDYSRADHVHGAPAINDLSNVSAAAPSDNDVLVYDNATSTWVAEAPAAGGVSAIGTSAADVLSVSGSDLVADDGGTIDSADPFIKWDDTAGKLVYANPLSRPTGAFYVGLAPTTTALGSNAINIQTTRNNALRVASGAGAVCVDGSGSGMATGSSAVCINASTANADSAVSIGLGSSVSLAFGVAIGRQAAASQDCVAIGTLCGATQLRATAIGRQVVAALRSEFATRPFRAVYWGGQTTDATPTILNLDATATNRFTIAANTALAVDVLLVARRSDTADKWLVARRFLGIRRDGSNNTSLIGAVQTLGTDQSDGSPSWSFALTADDTNEALQLEVTGAASETVQWRATAFYHVV